MVAYKTLDKYFFSLDKAIEYAKNNIRERYYPGEECSEIWKITQGKNNGYCVTIEDAWEKIGNKNLLRNSIATIEIE